MLFDVVYLVVAILALPWVAWRRLSGRRPVAALWPRLIGTTGIGPPPPGTKRLWLHGVSVGEVQLLASLALELEQQARDLGHQIEVVLSSSTTTGLDLAAKRLGNDRTFPCPLDFSWAVTRALRSVQPAALVLGELELWPNLLRLATRKHIPVVIANARMSPRSFQGYSRIRPLVHRMLSNVAVVSARSETDAERFEALGARDVRVTGSMKFDGVRGDREAPEVSHLRDLAGIAPHDVIFLAGSTQAPEEELAVKAFCTLREKAPQLKLIIVPRHVERMPEITTVLDRADIRWQARSRLESDGVDHGARVLVVDTTGELASWWGTATIAFVGGSLDGKRGGQNMIEPAAYGAAVCFGPYTRNFRDEVARLVEAEAAVIVADGEALKGFVARCLAEPDSAAAMGARASSLVAKSRGATATTARLILGQLNVTVDDSRDDPT